MSRVGGDLVGIDEIGADVVLRFRDDVAVVPVADEAVLYEEATGGLHLLDPIAAIVCSFVDGRRTVGDVIDELAKAFDERRSTIEADVLALVGDLGGKDLLEGIAPSAEEHADGP